MDSDAITPLSSPPAIHRWRTYAAPLLLLALVTGGLLWLNPLPWPQQVMILCLAALSAILAYLYARNRQLRQLVQAQAQLLDANERSFRHALDDASQGMALVAADGKWLQVNKAVCRITGYSAEELLTLDFQTLTHPDDLYADLHYVEQVLARKIETYSMEKRYIRKDGTIVWILLSVSAAWDAEGHFRYFISEVHDIHERKMLQERLRASEARLRHPEIA